MLFVKDFFPSDVIAFTTDRSVDFALDTQKLSNQQIDLLSTYIGDNTSQLFNIRQIHEDGVLVVKEFDPQIQEADGLLTDRYHLPLAVRTADCVPVFVCDVKLKVIGIVHAGWRGVKKRILAKAVLTLVDQWKSRVEDLRFAFGPAIRSCCYEVGEEFKDVFPDDLVEKNGSKYLDLSSAIRRQLTQLKVNEEQIHDCKKCTNCESRYFSYRRQKEKAGRMLSVIMLQSKKS